MNLTYRILTYILIPVGLLFGLFTLISLTAVFSNISVLLPVFFCGATTIYIFASFKFLHTGLLPNKPLRRNVYDWIRVNGFVAMFVATLFIVQGIVLRGNPNLVSEMSRQLEVMSEQMPDQKMPDINVSKLIRAVLDFMLGVGLLLGTHVGLGFVILRKNMALFSE